MATKYSLDVFDAETGEWTSVALFSDIVSIDVLADMGRTTTTLLIGNNLASVAYSSATAAISVELTGHSLRSKYTIGQP